MTPIFVGGTGRSGTTILRKILGCHPEIASLYQEIRLIVDPGGALDLVSALSERWSPFVADAALHAFEENAVACLSRSLPSRIVRKACTRTGFTPPRYRHLDVAELGGWDHFRETLERLLDALVDHRSHANWIGGAGGLRDPVLYETHPRPREEVARAVGRFFDELFAGHAKSPRATHWVDDTPYSVLHAGELLPLFPQMRMIHILRDPRDVVSSYRTTAWGGEQYAVIARRVASVLERWQERRTSLPEGAYRELRLEDLVAQPRARLEELCDFLGLDYDPALESLPLNKANSGRWRRDLEPETRQQVQEILAPAVAAFGYEEE